MTTELLTTTEAGRLLGVNNSRVRQLIAEGRITAQRFGRAWMIKAESLSEFTRRKRGPKSRQP